MSTHRPAPAGPRGGPMGGFGGPPAKSKDFKGSLKRLLKVLSGERNILIGVIALITTSVTIGAFGPKILGRATNYIFYGYLGRMLPAGISKQTAIEDLNRNGEHRLAQMLQNSGVIPGRGVDFSAISRIITLALVLYLISSLFSWVQGYFEFNPDCYLSSCDDDLDQPNTCSYFTHCNSSFDVCLDIHRKEISKAIYCPMGLDWKTQWSCRRDAYWPLFGEGIWSS